MFLNIIRCRTAWKRVIRPSDFASAIKQPIYNNISDTGNNSSIFNHSWSSSQQLIELCIIHGMMEETKEIPCIHGEMCELHSLHWRSMWSSCCESAVLLFVPLSSLCLPLPFVEENPKDLQLSKEKIAPHSGLKWTCKQWPFVFNSPTK